MQPEHRTVRGLRLHPSGPGNKTWAGLAAPLPSQPRSKAKNSSKPPAVRPPFSFPTCPQIVLQTQFYVRVVCSIRAGLFRIVVIGKNNFPAQRVNGLMHQPNSSKQFNSGPFFALTRKILSMLLKSRNARNLKVNAFTRLFVAIRCLNFSRDVQISKSLPVSLN